MSAEAKAILEGKLAAIAQAVEQARSYEHEHGLANRASRKLGASTLHTLRKWRQVTDTATARDTVTPVVVVEGEAARADTPEVKPSAHEEPQVPVSPQTSIRIPPELREAADQYGRERRWSFGEVVRVGLEQLVGYEPNDDQAEHRSVNGALDA